MRLAVAAAAAVPALLMAAAAPAPAAECPRAARCTTVTVPLDRSGAVPGTVRLRVARVRGRRSSRPPVVALAGGPGQANVEFTAGYRFDLGDALGTRDLIVFDARGTGGSGAIDCRRMQRATIRDTAAAEACAAQLGARRRFYTTVDQAEDVEAVRAALKVERIALYGISYGTKVALTYSRLHPDRVDRLALDSVAPAEGASALSQETLGAMPRVLGRGLTGELRALNDRLRSTRTRGRYVDARGRARSVGADANGVFDVLLAGDFNPMLRRALRPAATAAAGGDPALLVRLIESARAEEATPASPRELSAGLYAATSCGELAFPWAPGDAPEERLRKTREALAQPGVVTGAFAPDDVPGLDWISLCLRWPQTPGPRPLPPPADVPALLLAGTEDLRTPVESAEQVRAQLPRARLVTIPGGGHAVVGFDACARRALERFMSSGGAPSRCRRSPARYVGVPVPPASLDAVRPLGRLRGKVGRTARALQLTLRDATVGLALSATGDATGGLRGGYLRFGEVTGRFRRFEYVPGVVLDGPVNAAGAMRLRVGGRAAARGRVRVDEDGRIRGRLGGRAVSFAGF